MPGFVFRDPNNPASKYETWNPNDPNVPIGWLFCWSNGEMLREIKQFEPGGSGGWPPVTPENIGTRLRATPNRSFDT